MAQTVKRAISVLLAILVVGTAFGCNLDGTSGSGSPPQRGSVSRGAGNGNGTGRGAALRRNVGNGAAVGGMSEDIGALVSEVPPSEISEQEMSGLLFMLEEEKLARDVYAALYDAWNLQIFQSISGSEAQHMDSIRWLLERYGIDDSVGSTAPGAFADSDLQTLYDELVAEGRVSLIAALSVGATIEDLDIADLEEQIETSDNDDIQIVYQNLMKGSRNHLRSFIAQLDRFGTTYTAQYIDAEQLQRILSISRETAPITDPDYTL